MATLPYFRWYPADARNDETYAGMTVEELGLYHAIIDHTWGNNGCPADPVKAATAIGHGVTAAQFRRVFPGISSRFIEKDGRLFERRQEVEREQAIAKSLKNQRFGNANAKLSRPEREKNASQRAYESESESESPLIDKTSSTETESDAREKSEVVELAVRKQDDWFEEKFWPLWPVKENKIQAKRAAAKIKESEREAVLAGVLDWAFRIKAMERPIHASTWLNNRRWEDEKHKPGAREPTLFPTTPLRESFADGVVRRAQERAMRGERPI